MTAAARSRRYWENELGGLSEGPHVLGVAYRWLLTLRKVQRPQWGGAANTAEAYLNELAAEMLAVAREISQVDQMTNVQAEDYWRKTVQPWAAKRRAAS